MSGGEAEAGAKGGNVIVGTGGFVFGGDADNGPEGGGDGRDGDGDGDGRLVKLGGYFSKHSLSYRA